MVSVYKYYDKHGILIYVGITSGGILRNRQHNASKPWWPFVSTQEVEHYSDRDSAHVREVELIQTYKPAFNAQHNSGYKVIRRAYLDFVESDLCGLTAKQLVTTGMKRTIRLHPVQNGHFTSFLAHPEDNPLMACVKAARGASVHCDQFGRLGTVRKLDRVGTSIRIIAKLDRRYRHRIVSAQASLRFVSMKTPVEIEIRNIHAQLD